MRPALMDRRILKPLGVISDMHTEGNLEGLTLRDRVVDDSPLTAARAAWMGAAAERTAWLTHLQQYAITVVAFG